MSSAWSSGYWAKPAFATISGVIELAIRSLPPPILSFCAYVASLHVIGSPNSANARLNAGRWPSRSVSASTPSQSKINAGMAHTFPALPKMFAYEIVISRTALLTGANRLGGSHLPAASAVFR